jgi:hypothetical protein
MPSAAAALAVAAGAADQVGDRPQCRLGFREQAHDVGLARHVARQCDGLAAFGLDVGHDLLGLRVAAWRAVSAPMPEAPPVIRRVLLMGRWYSARQDSGGKS